MEDFRDIAAIVLFHRKKSGLSQKDLAELAGVGKTVVFDIEKGKDSIRFNSLWKVIKVLNIKIVFDSKIMEEYSNEAS